MNIEEDATKKSSFTKGIGMGNSNIGIGGAGVYGTNQLNYSQ